MQFIEQQYAIIGQYRSNSNNGTGRMTTINMRGISDNKHYITYVVDKYHNAKQWKSIVDNPATGYIVTFESGKLSKAGQIDADSKPVIITTAPTVDIHAVLDEVHNLKPKKRKPTRDEMLAQVDAMRKTIEDLFE